MNTLFGVPEANVHLKKQYVENIRRATAHPMLRLAIDLVALLAVIGAIRAVILLLMQERIWVAIVNLVMLLVIYAIRGLAVLVVDSADMLISQGTKPTEPEKLDSAQP